MTNFKLIYFVLIRIQREMYSDTFFIYGHIKHFIEILRMIENQVVQIIILCV